MSEPEAMFLVTWKAIGGRSPITEMKFDPKRRWRFDMAWPESKIALEIEGGVWSGGRHTRGAGFIKDAEKYNRAAMMGWRVLRITPDQIQPLYLEEIRDAMQLG